MEYAQNCDRAGGFRVDNKVVGPNNQFPSARYSARPAELRMFRKLFDLGVNFVQQRNCCSGIGIGNIVEDG